MKGRPVFASGYIPCPSCNGRGTHIGLGICEMCGGDGRIFCGEQEGLTMGEHACIQLRVPRSGDDDLDALIKEARRHEAAVRAMEGLLANPERYKYITKLVSEGMTQEFATAKNAYRALKMADALIKEL